MNAVIAVVEDVLSREVSQQSGCGSDMMFRARAQQLLYAVLPALTWLEVEAGFPLDVDSIEGAFDLRWIRSFACWGVVLLKARATDDTRIFRAVQGVPERIAAPLRRYLSDLPGGFATDDDAEGAAERHHAMATFYFRIAFNEVRRRGPQWLHLAAAQRHGAIQSRREF